MSDEEKTIEELLDRVIFLVEHYDWKPKRDSVEARHYVDMGELLIRIAKKVKELDV